MYTSGLVLLLSFAFVCAKRHVIQITPKLRQQGYHEDIDLGEVITEAVVDSQEACGRLCKENPACHSVMLMGQLCRMFAPEKCQCSPDVRPLAGSSSRYLIGQDASMTSFQSAMAKCLSLGAHSVHINSKEEHDVIKQYIWNSAVRCTFVWTGGRSSIAGSTDITDWRWYYNNEFTGPSEPFTYLRWGAGQPNNRGSNQFYMSLYKHVGYNFNDMSKVSFTSGLCYLCECP